MTEDERIPNERLSTHTGELIASESGTLEAPPAVSLQDRDNFVRDLITVIGGDCNASADAVRRALPPIPLSGSALALDPVLTLADVKMHLRIETDQTREDGYLATLEMAARLHTQNELRRTIDATVGENVKVAMLLLIAHWYRNRETVGATMSEAPLAYKALLFPERDFPLNTY